MDSQLLTETIAAADELYQKGKLESALSKYEEAITIDPQSAWGHSRIGAILAQLGEEQMATEELETALQLDPKLPQAHSNLGNIYYAKGDYENALKKYKEAATLDPHNPVFHENMHAALKKLGKLTEAVAALKQAHKAERESAKVEAKKSYSKLKERARNKVGCLSVLVIIAALIALVI